ncbi:MAG: twin-arginine translocase TatA/TatE family subunit [Terriglobales bacterium]|jgi:sec-independent protein translocase protein TatB
MNFGFSGEMIFLFLLALILFGPKKMPEIGRQVARFLNEFRRASYEFRSQIESEINSLDTTDTSDRNAGSSIASSRRQQILTPIQAPLGSLANRIFNPPPAEKLEAAENAAAEIAAAPVAAAEAAPAEPAPVPEPAPAPRVEAPKVAPDA